MKREFRIQKSNKIHVWKIWQEGESYHTEHGLIDGKKQTFSDTPGPKGKENTKAYVTALDNCLFNINREIRKKIEHGYIEYIDGDAVSAQITSLDFKNFIPKNFCSYKPQTSISNSSLNKIHKSGNAQYTRKYDGLMHLCVHHTWGWEIYTRRMDLASERFPSHIKALENLSEDLEAGTVLVGEMVCHTEDGRDDFKSISRICRSDPPEARKLVEDGECPEPTYRIFDILFHNGQSLKDTSFRNRRSIWKNALNMAQKQNPSMESLVDRVCFFDLTPDNWEEYAKENGWEGFVVVDLSSIPGDKFYSFDGDAKRPKGHHKLKPVYEDDVVIYAGVKGTGKRLGTVGSVLVKQRHPDTGEWFRCGKVGSGFTDEDIADIEKQLKDNDLPLFDKEKEDKDDLTDNGIVTMIEYGERQPGTNKFRFPVFIRTRTDKTARECVAQRLAPDE